MEQPKKKFKERHPLLERILIVTGLDLIIFAIGFTVWWMFKDTSNISNATWVVMPIAIIALTIVFWKSTE